MTIQEELSTDIDWRNGELAELKVILHKVKLTPDQRITYMRYIVPAIYALWEGYIKKSLELYSKVINASGIPITQLHENLLTHAIASNDNFALDKVRTRFETQKNFSIHICEYIGGTFPINKLPTKSNVNGDVLNDLLNRFNLGVIEKKICRELDKLLLFRNTIAHGDNSIPVKEEHIYEFSSLIQKLMVLIFEKIDKAVTDKTYLNKMNDNIII